MKLSRFSVPALAVLLAAPIAAFAAPAGAAPANGAAKPPAVVDAVPMNSKPIPGTETDHYTQGPDGTTIRVRTFAVDSSVQPFTTSQGPDFNYTYDYTSNLRGRDMFTYSGRFCNVVDVLNRSAPGQDMLLSLYKNSGGQVSPTVRVSTAGTGWCWGGVQNNTDYHYTYSMDTGFYGFDLNGSGHSYA